MPFSTTIVCFSPTGTSLQVGRAVAGSLDPDFRVLDATHSALDPVEFSRDDVVIISAPVYGGHMAPIASQRFQKIRGQETPAVLVAVYGNRMFENALADMVAFAEERGFRPIALAAFVGEHSYSSVVTPIAVGRPDDADIAEARTFGKAVAEKLGRGDLSAPDCERMTDEPVSPQSEANFLGFVKNYLQQRGNRPIDLPKTDVEVCLSCGACVEACPVDAIDGSNEYRTDESSCIKCCACVKACHSGARTFSSPFAPVLSANFSARKSPRWML